MSIVITARHLGFTALVAALSVADLVEHLRSPSCDDLWAERNAILKFAGYCFVEERAIARFGNEDCHIRELSDVRLSAADVLRMNGLREREATCGR